MRLFSCNFVFQICFLVLIALLKAIVYCRKLKVTEHIKNKNYLVFYTLKLLHLKKASLYLLKLIVFILKIVCSFI